MAGWAVYRKKTIYEFEKNALDQQADKFIKNYRLNLQNIEPTSRCLALKVRT
ncbi:hypothetical protein NCCP133_35770 [Cytobacillus sp. NCCP-133]|nr:hypothetical protein NCCP133_35770 [Cytobacillus sp. NCCP-133]